MKRSLLSNNTKKNFLKNRILFFSRLLFSSIYQSKLVAIRVKIETRNPAISLVHIIKVMHQLLE